MDFTPSTRPNFDSDQQPAHMSPGNVQHFQQHHCEVCGCDVNFVDILAYKDMGGVVCQSFDCKKIFQEKDMTPTLYYESQVNYQKQRYRERKELEEKKKKYVAERLHLEAEENKKIKSLVLEEYVNSEEQTIHIVALPKGLSNLIPLSEKRINAYLQHIIVTARDAFQYISEPEANPINEHSDIREKLDNLNKTLAENPTLHKVSDKLCAQCKGGCCTSGRDNAYLSPITMVRVIENNPTMTEEEIVSLYASYISTDSIAGACINQTGTGCALPNELRSDTCNSYYCPSLLTYQKEAKPMDSEMILSIQRNRTCWKEPTTSEQDAITNVSLLTSDSEIMECDWL